MQLLSRIRLCAAAIAIMSAGVVFATPPTDEQITEMQTKLREFQMNTPRAEMTMEKYQAFIGELVKDLDPSELSAAQMEKLFQMLQNVPAKKEAAQARLQTLAAADDVDGARASVMYCQTLNQEDQKEARLAAYQRALTHPALGEVINGKNGGAIFQQVAYAGEDVTKSLAKEVLGLQQYLTADLPAENVASTMDYLAALNGMGDVVDAATKENVRVKMVTMFKEAAAVVKTEVAAAEAKGDNHHDQADDKSGANAEDKAKAKAKAEAELKAKKGLADYLDKSVAFLDGAASRGQLMDQAAPTITFNWFSGDKPVKSFADLKGKVVVVDFWATWCGPCVGSFPDVRELQKRYEGYDVAIVGVTSLQGSHSPGDGAKSIDTKGDPQKEYDLMKEYIAKKDITWAIAFSEQNVFNPDFGVRGIPHVAIIDPAGVVRYNNLDPRDPMKEKAEKIDGLLAKAGLPAPAPVVEEPKAEDEKDDGKGG